MTLTPAYPISDGNNGANYAVTFVADTTGQITPRAVMVAAASSTKGYDGATSSTAAPTITASGLGVVATLAGWAGQTGSSDGTGSTARFDDPSGVATDSAGNVYVADSEIDGSARSPRPAWSAPWPAPPEQLPGSSDGTGSAGEVLWSPKRGSGQRGQRLRGRHLQ